MPPIYNAINPPSTDIFLKKIKISIVNSNESTFFYVHIHTIATIDRHRTTAGTFSSFVFSIKKKKKLFFVSLLTGFFLLNIQNSTYMGLGRAW